MKWEWGKFIYCGCKQFVYFFSLLGFILVPCCLFFSKLQTDFCNDCGLYSSNNLRGIHDIFNQQNVIMVTATRLLHFVKTTCGIQVY